MKVYGLNRCVAPPILPRHYVELSGQLDAPIYTRGKNLRGWARPRDGAYILDDRRLSRPCQHSAARLLLSVRLTDPSTASYSPCSASSRSSTVCPAPAPSHLLLHALLTCKLTTTPTDPYNDREASCAYCWSIHRQFCPSASPFLSYRLDPVTSVSISVGCFSVFLRKPSVCRDAS